MEGNYPVYFGDNPCGKVQVLRQGLYYKFVCRCRLSGEVVCRLKICFDHREENLGVLIPMDGGFGLNTKIPVKRFPENPVRFRIQTAQEFQKGSYVPIYPEEPFAYIEKLKDAFLTVKNGQAGVVIAEK